jgi:hypothetical protein
MSNIITPRQQINRPPPVAATRGAEKAARTEDSATADVNYAKGMQRKSDAEYQEATGREHSELFKSAENSQKQNFKNRAQQRDAKPGLLSPSELKDKARQLWGEQGEAKLAQLAERAIHTLKDGGASALLAMRRGLDPLEQSLLLSKMLEQMGEGESPAHKDVEDAALQVHLKHGAEIKRLAASGTPMAQLEETPPTQAQEMRGLRSAAARSTGDAVLSAVKLIPLLLEKFGAKDFEASLRRMGESSVTPDLKKSHPTRDSTRVRIAMTNGAVLNTVRKAFKKISSLRPRLAAHGLRLKPDDDPMVAGRLLEECSRGVNNPGHLASSLFGADNGQSIMDNPRLLKALRYLVDSTPENWWPQDKKGNAPERLQVLEKTSERILRLEDSGVSPLTERREKSLRSSAKHLPTPSTKGAPTSRAAAAA